MSHDQPEIEKTHRGESEFKCLGCGSTAENDSDCCGSPRKKLCDCGSRAYAEHCCEK